VALLRFFKVEGFHLDVLLCCDFSEGSVGPPCLHLPKAPSIVVVGLGVRKIFPLGTPTAINRSVRRTGS
jgi:hypothetical protein